MASVTDTILHWQPLLELHSMTLSYTSVCSYHSAALAGGELSGARAVSTAADHNLWLSVFLHEVQLLAAAPRAAVARAGLALACWLSSRWSACWPSHFQPSAGSARWQRKPHHSAFLCFSQQLRSVLLLAPCTAAWRGQFSLLVRCPLVVGCPVSTCCVDTLHHSVTLRSHSPHEFRIECCCACCCCR